MCNLNKKLVLFDYTVEQFVKWDKEITNRQQGLDNEVLKSFSFTRFMKLLYFTCLESVNVENSDIGLFKIFRKFLAYENGPVEVDVYNNRSFLFRYKFNGRFLERRKKEDEQKENEEKLYEVYSNKLEGYKEEKKAIDEAIKKLRKRNKDIFHMENTIFLVELSHNLKLWKSASFFSYPIIDTSIKSLKEEKELFEKIFN